MPHDDRPQIRAASRADADAIAALHAESWRRHYRGAFSDAFLDGDVDADRVAVWRARLRAPDPARHTILAEDATGLIGFAHTVFDHHPRWGALLDNLHIVHRSKRRGVGSQLMAATAQTVIERRTGLYLWVLEQNVAAQAFYTARSGRPVERALVSAPGGVATRLNGAPAELRFVWTDPATLITSR